MKLIVNETQYNKLVTEERGFSKSVEEWSKVVVDEIMEFIFKIENEDVLLMTNLSLKYGSKDFFKNLPIDSIIINVNIKKTKGDEGSGDVGYIPHWSHMEDRKDAEGKWLEDVEFTLRMNIPESSTFEENYQDIHDYLFQMFTHEFLHVYEWFKRDLVDPSEKTDCMGLFTDGDLHGNVVERLSYLIYTQLSFEMNAFIQQAGTMLRMREINSYDDFKKELESLFIWEFVKEMLDFNVEDTLFELKSISNEDMELFNNIKLCYYSNKDEEGELTINPKSLTTSTATFLEDLDKRFKVRGEVMKRKLYKLSSDIL